MNRRFLACLALAGALAAGAPLAALPVYVKIAPPPPPVEVKVVAPGKGLFLDRRIPPVDRHRICLGARPVGAAPAPGRGVGAGHWKGTPSGWVWKAGRWH